MKTNRILFQEYRTGEIDEFGVSTSNWADVRYAWAEIEHRNGTQKWGSGGFSAETTDLFRIVYVPGWEPDESMRIIWKGRIYDIEHVNNILEANQDIEIEAAYKERVLGK